MVEVENSLTHLVYDNSQYGYKTYLYPLKDFSHIGFDIMGHSRAR